MDRAGRLVTAPVRLERRGKLLVAVPLAELTQLTHELVEKTRAMIHDERSVTAGANRPKRKRR